MKKYSSYKDSGVEWIGEIPSEWRLVRMKFLGDAIGGITYSPSEVTDNVNDFLVLRSSNIQKGQLSLSDTVYVNAQIPDKKILQKGDILICSRNGSKHLIGKNICIDERTEGQTFGAFMMIFRSRYWMFLSYFFNSPIFKSQSGLFLTSTINQLTSGTLNNFYLAIPNTFNEQTQIANYLDHKTQQIDSLIAKKEHLIELLEEERTAIINQAVTKGLDPNVPMKDSGIDWLGEIPEHWELRKLKFVFNLISSKTDKRPDYLIALENIESWTGKVQGSYNKEDFEGSVNLFKKGDILFNKLRPYLAKVVLTNNDGGAVSELLVLRSKSGISSRFMFYRMISEMIISIIDGSTYGAKMPRANWSSFISELKIGVPVIDEQIEISNFLDKKLAILEKTKSKLSKEIEYLKEYKTTLISDVVTGKIDVGEEIIN